jgi:hypothetical protein
MNPQNKVMRLSIRKVWQKAVAESSQRCERLQAEVNLWKDRCQELIEERDSLLNKQKSLQELLLVCQQKQGNLSGRVAILEVQRASWKSKAYVFVGQTGSRLTYVAKFVRKLFPEMKSSEGLKALFDVIYEHKKHFALTSIRKCGRCLPLYCKWMLAEKYENTLPHGDSFK